LHRIDIPLFTERNLNLKVSPVFRQCEEKLLSLVYSQ
jgi:hypothetical protein